MPHGNDCGNYVNLIRRGRHYVCNCPFHSEKSPSCTIFPETQSFYCFGCGAGGDVITWVRRMDNLEFQLKSTERILRSQIMKSETLILGEVERVHLILDQHIHNQTMHTALV